MDIKQENIIINKMKRYKVELIEAEKQVDNYLKEHFEKETAHSDAFQYKADIIQFRDEFENFLIHVEPTNIMDRIASARQSLTRHQKKFEKIA